MPALIRKVNEMNCYLCEKTPGLGGTHFHVKAAVGICHDCGVAVCLEHSHKTSEPGSPLLCPTCAELRREAEIEGAHRQPVLQTT